MGLERGKASMRLGVGSSGVETRYFKPGLGFTPEGGWGGTQLWGGVRLELTAGCDLKVIGPRAGSRVWCEMGSEGGKEGGLGTHRG